MKYVGAVDLNDVVFDLIRLGDRVFRLEATTG